ncbi:cysteine hydrolase family protein [Novosphingobium decolorationis]|uniref:Cysteine hydrolase n=1 Tax=Novosphingobium decolorationis TaxID=2698673 RepID=A0ABX8E3S1_9SPHN|nr:isochorismatase family cysteine hydrolase [Novosphingobium decolorationis]MED5545051.1 isochorismatase family cysteine hydrolase [Pseudomonadota bacterium]QVM83639.1 cysteine hydrolase [Novosphingobium decolorationis]
MSKYLILIDFINDLTSHDPMAGELARRNVVANAASVLEKARKAGVAVGHVRVAFSAPDLPEAPERSPLFANFKGSGALQLGTPGVDFVPALTPAEGEAIILKHQISPFWKTILDEELEKHGVTELYVTGLSTTLAVSSTVREAHDRGLSVKVIADACSAGSLEAHEAELQAFGGLCEITEAAKVSFAD